jgi:3-oxo-5alpha-steroid 4-dehydrogenase
MASRVDELVRDDKGMIVGVKYRSMSPTSASLEKHKKLIQQAVSYRQISVPFLADWYDGRANRIWAKEARPTTLTAKAVVLAAGGFALNSDLMKKHIPWADRIAGLGTVGDDGSGIRLGQSRTWTVCQPGD